MLAPMPKLQRSKPTAITSSGGLVILTDLDGVLCDPDSSSLAGARDALEVLGVRNVPVVLCSERSAAELICLQRMLDIRAPFICESGGAVYIPRDYFVEPIGGGNDADWEVIEFGAPYAEVSAALRRTAASLQIPLLHLDVREADQLSPALGRSLFGAEGSRARQYDAGFLIPACAAHTTPRTF